MSNLISSQFLVLALMYLFRPAMSLPREHRQISSDGQRFDLAECVTNPSGNRCAMAKLQQEHQNEPFANGWIFRDIPLLSDGAIQLKEESTSNAEYELGALDLIGRAVKQVTDLVDQNAQQTANVSPDTETSQLSKECAICLDSFEPEDKFLTLKCEHKYHHNCIIYWAKHTGRSHPVCPVCRAELVLEDGDQLNSRDDLRVE